MSLLLTTAVVPLVAHSQVYLTEEQACQAIYPNGEMTRKQITLTPDEIKRIEDKLGEKLRVPSLIVWSNAKKEVLFVDQVLGKHEFITFAVGINPNKQVSGIDILEYRETYGQQVKGEKWRSQFVGKTASSNLKLNQDIANISGATLSSSHITNGVRRILQTYEVIRDRL